MNNSVSNIIKRILSLPQDIKIYELNTIGSDFDFFDLKVYIEDAIYFLSMENPFSNMRFDNDNIKIISEDTKCYFEDISLINEEIIEIKSKSKKNSDIICKALSDLSKPIDYSLDISIEKKEKPLDDECDIKIVQIQNFKINENKTNLLKKINDEVVEYFIRDYVYCKTGFIIEHGIEYFIRGFRATNCREPFSENYSFKDKETMFSEEFKEYICFETKDEMNNTIELLDLNFSI